MKKFFLRIMLAWQAFKNADKLRYRLIWDLDWEIKTPDGGSPAAFIDGLNKFVRVEVRAIDGFGSDLRTVKPFMQRVASVEVRKIMV